MQTRWSYQPWVHPTMGRMEFFSSWLELCQEFERTLRRELPVHLTVNCQFSETNVPASPNSVVYQLVLFNPNTRNRGTITVTMTSASGLQDRPSRVRADLHFQLRPGSQYNQTIQNVACVPGFQELLCSIGQEAYCIDMVWSNDNYIVNYEEDQE